MNRKNITGAHVTRDNTATAETTTATAGTPDLFAFVMGSPWMVLSGLFHRGVLPLSRCFGRA